jgi:hypothetical protein
MRIITRCDIRIVLFPWLQIGSIRNTIMFCQRGGGVYGGWVGLWIDLGGEVKVEGGGG